MKEPIEYLWQDTKRILGMPLTFTKYKLSHDRLFLKKGMLNLSFDEVVLYRVTDLTLKISLGQRIFGVGSVFVHSSDKTTPHLELKNIKHPMEVKEMIHQQVEEMKIERKVRMGELMDDDCAGDEEDYES